MIERIFVAIVREQVNPISEWDVPLAWLVFDWLLTNFAMFCNKVDLHMALGHL